MFEDKTIDPRLCTYRLLASSKLRKQIDRLIRKKKIEYGIIIPKNDIDFYNRLNYSSLLNENNLVNRKNNKKKDSNDDNDLKDLNDNDNDDNNEQRKQIIKKMEEVENIFSRAYDEQKQTFTYNDLIELHRLLQHLDTSETMDLAKEYFYEFFEENFRVMQMPEKRSNASLDERLRKLRLKAASDEYDSMISNVANYVTGNTNTKKYSLSQDLRQIRSTLLATINAMMVIGTTFLFFYLTINYARPDYDTGKVVLYSFAASLVVAMAEIYFLMFYNQDAIKK